MLRAFLFVVALLGATTAWPISRVGNGRLFDKVEGFDTELSKQYTELRELPNEGIVFQSPPRLINDGKRPPHFGTYKVELRRFSSEFSDLKGYTREQLKEFFLSATGTPWREVTSPYGCALAVQAQAGGLHQIFLMWGQGRGLVLLGDEADEVRETMELAVRELRLLGRDCAWN